jgi:hypothetical protein
VEITEDLWLTRAEVADRYKLPLKTIAEWHRPPLRANRQARALPAE